MVIACLTQQSLNDKVCSVLCKSGANHRPKYDWGFSKDVKCFCVMNMGFLSDFEAGQIKVPAIHVENVEPVKVDPVAEFHD